MKKIPFLMIILFAVCGISYVQTQQTKKEYTVSTSGTGTDKLFVEKIEYVYNRKSGLLERLHVFFKKSEEKIGDNVLGYIDKYTIFINVEKSKLVSAGKEYILYCVRPGSRFTEEKILIDTFEDYEFFIGTEEGDRIVPGNITEPFYLLLSLEVEEYVPHKPTNDPIKKFMQNPYGESVTKNYNLKIDFIPKN